ncbi:MAG TPA: O-antigen ligase family protein [Candidatus Angelobacter sp.]
MVAIVILPFVTGGLVYFLSKRPIAAVVAVVAAGAMARLYVDLFGMKARPEHFATVLFCLALPFWKRYQWPRPRWALADLFLVLYMAANLLSSLIMSVDPPKTFRWAMQQVLVILPYFLLRIFCFDRERFRKAFNILLIVGAAQAAIGVFCFFSNLAFDTEFGMEMGQYGAIPGTYGVDYEANILGAISAAAFVMMLVMYLKERRPILLWGTAVTFAGMLIALARSAIVASVIAVGLFAILSIKAGLIDMSGFKRVVGALLVTCMVIVPFIIPLYVDRFSTIDVSDISADDDTAFRVVALVTAMDGITAHPILGNGTSSFQLLVSYSDMDLGDSDKGTWISNTELRVLHDTGIVGFGLLLCFLGNLAWRAVKILKQEWIAELLALLLACVVYAITFQATEGTLMEFFWVHIGLLGCAISVYENQLKQANSNSNSSGNAYT